VTQTIIITICSLLIVAYLFDLSSARTRIPSVILLLALGWTVRQVTGILDLQLPDLTAILPVLGTVGLILIVLEGSLELELNRSKFRLIRSSLLGALLPMLALAFLLAWGLGFAGIYTFKDRLINVIPFCVISSAIAIPSVRTLSAHQKEFVIYESSLSDIFGVLFFNFIAFNESFGASSFGVFGLQLLLIIVVSFVATLGLSLLLHKIDHHIKYVPIILIVVLIYEIAKVYHLPALIFIMLFGLFLGNLDELRAYKWMERFGPEELDREVKKFRDLLSEGAFLIRALFFLLFGYLIETRELFNASTLIWAGVIVAGIFILRAMQLKLSGLPLSPLLFIAPRGLITVLLFLSVTADHTIPLVNRSLVIQVVILSALVMMGGLMSVKKPEKEIPDPVKEQHS
jgi:potassium/hydrogen antiporter